MSDHILKVGDHVSAGLKLSARALPVFFLALTMAGCTSGSNAQPDLPVVGMVPEACTPVLWVQDVRCYEVTYYRCSQGPTDQVYKAYSRDGETPFIYMSRTRGLTLAALASEGSEWAFYEASTEADPEALLSGGTTDTAFNHVDDTNLNQWFEFTFSLRGESRMFEGLTMSIIDLAGRWWGEEFEAAPVVGLLYYVEEVDLFHWAVADYGGEMGAFVDGSPTHMSLNGPIMAECTRRQ